VGIPLAALVTPSYRFDLPGLVRQLYGADAVLHDAEVPVSRVLFQGDPHAATFSGHHWVFDWDRITSWLEQPVIARGFYAVFVLQPDAGFHGFAMFENGELGRLRVGTTEQGIISDFGPVLEPERETINRLFLPEEAARMQTFWSGCRQHSDGVTQNLLGASVVLDLIAYQTGALIPPDHELPAAFFSETAHQVAVPDVPNLSRFHQA